MSSVSTVEKLYEVERGLNERMEELEEYRRTVDRIKARVSTSTPSTDNVFEFQIRAQNFSVF